MSPNVNDFIGQIADAYRALQAEPAYQDRIKSLEDKVETYAETVTNRETRLLERNAEIDALQSQLRNAEAARDDAELRFLESEEIADKVRVLLNVMRSKIADADELLVKPAQGALPTNDEPAPMVHDRPLDSSLQFEADRPYTGSSESTTQASGQSEGGPTAPFGSGEALPSADSAEPLGPSVVSSTGTELAGEKPEVKPYAGKRYVDHPLYVSHGDWTAGGGSDEDYFWRPGPQS